MAKTIRFPLEMKDGAQARTLAELKEHWDVEKIVAHFSSGKLMTWLRDRPYENERTQVEALDEKDSEELRQKLSAIFGMKYEAGEKVAEDVETVRDRQDRLNRLRQATTDKEILDDVDHAAFNQDDLWDIVGAGAKKVYLVNNTFEISLTDKDMTYIGVGKAIVKIDSEETVDFEELGIRFENVQLNEKQEVLSSNQVSQNDTEYESEHEYEFNRDLDFGFSLFYGAKDAKHDVVAAKRWFESAAEKGNELAKEMLNKYENLEQHTSDSIKKLAWDFFCAGEAVLRINDYRRAKEYFERANAKAQTNSENDV